MSESGVLNLARKRVLVTGASGFIGSALCHSLLTAGAEVHGVSRTARAADRQIRWWQADVRNADDAHNLVASIKPHLVFHLAGESRAHRQLDLVLPTFGNLSSSVNLLAAAEAHCERVVLAGSLDEPDADEPASSPYTAAHVAIRAYMRMFHAIFATPAVIARIFMTYGPGQRAVHKLIPYVTLSFLRNESPQLSSGHRKVDWIYIDDLVEGLLAAAQAPAIEGSTIDLGSGTLTSVRDVVEELARLSGSQARPVFGAIGDRPMEQSRIANVEETFRRIGWKPRTSLTEGLRRTIAGYRSEMAAEKANTRSAS